MTGDVYSAILVAVMAAVTILLRFLPFLVFNKETPAYIAYLGKVLPSAIIGMLVIYCLRETEFTAVPFGLPELAAAAVVVLMQIWKRNSVLSILAGTIAYMVMIQMLI
ncbi:MAG: AzlD domain-containing protein [Eubacterium sp.]|nr:AzlD domain-containing protein [Eubacterium sp.]